MLQVIHWYDCRNSLMIISSIGNWMLNVPHTRRNETRHIVSYTIVFNKIFIWRIPSFSWSEGSHYCRICDNLHKGVWQKSWQFSNTNPGVLAAQRWAFKTHGVALGICEGRSQTNETILHKDWNLCLPNIDKIEWKVCLLLTFSWMILLCPSCTVQHPSCN